MPSTVLQLRSGTTAQHAAFTGAPNEVTVDTTKKTLVVHDGTTAGGTALATTASAAAGDALRVLKTGDTMTGSLAISRASPTLTLDKTAASGQGASVIGSTNGKVRWVINLGGGDTESGSNAGSNFYITRYNDAGAGNGDVLSINRATGAASLAGSLTAAGLNTTGGITAGGAVSATNGFLIAPFNTGLRGTGLADEGGVYRFRVFSAEAAIGGVQVEGNAEHVPGVTIRMRHSVGGSTFDMSSGGTGSSAGGWVATSDQRVKYDNQVITNALDKVDQLTGYTYLRHDMKDLDGVAPRKAGLIAQDVLKVLPEALSIPANYDAAENTGGLLALDSYGVIGLLVNAVKELRAEVNALKAA